MTTPRSAWISLGIATVTAFMVVVDVSVVNVAFPSIADDLRASDATLSWVVSGYSVTLASALLLAGRLADRHGSKRIFVIGLIVFGLGSLASGLAPSVGVLITARVVQALGGAAVTPASLALVLPEFPSEQRSAAIGVWGSMGALGAAFGPSIGALLIDAFSWRAIFLINVPVVVVLVIVSAGRFENHPVPGARDEPLDLAGVLMGTIAVASLMLAIVQSADWGWSDPRVISLLVVAAVLFPVLVSRSTRHTNPLLDTGLFGYRSFRAVAIGFCVYSMGFFSGFLLNSLMLQRLWQFSVLEAGFGLTPGPLLATVVSAFAGRYADRYGHRWLLSVGSGLCALAYVLLLTRLTTEPDYLGVFLGPNLLVGLGVGLSIASMTSGAMSDLPPRRFAVGNATIRTVQQLGGALGISAVVAIFGSPNADELVDSFRDSYLWVAIAFAVAAAVIASHFPAGSAASRIEPTTVKPSGAA